MTVARTLPSSLTAHQGLVALAGGCDRQLAQVAELIATTQPIEANLEAQDDAVLDDLAVQLGIDVWDYIDERAKKIWLLKNWHTYQSVKGTPEGYAFFAQLADCELLQHRPPSHSFLGKSLTVEERERWEAIHPELVATTFRDKLVDPEAAIARHGHYLGHCFLYNTYPAYRAGEHLEYHDPETGETRNLTPLPGDKHWVQREAKREVEVRLEQQPGVIAATAGLACGWLLKPTAEQRVYKIQVSNAYEAPEQQRPLLPTLPSLVPLTGHWRRRAETLLCNYKSAYLGAALGRCFLGNTRPAERVAKIFKLYMPGRSSGRARSLGLTLGRTALGRSAPFCGEMVVDCRTAGRHHAMTVGSFFGAGYLLRSRARGRTARLFAIMQESLTGYEKYTINIAPFRRGRAGEWTAGKQKAGNYIYRETL